MHRRPRGYPSTADSLSVMFGPLNGVRTALVIGAAVAAIIAAAFGWWGAALVLLVAIAIHGAGWWWLWKQRTAGQ